MNEKENGVLIVIEGADGAGKATQTALLYDRLVNEGKNVERLDFPGYSRSRFGALIKECLTGTHGDFMGLDPYLASLPYALDRFEEKNTIETWLKKGSVVLLDRYVSANMLHQGAKFENDADALRFFSWIETFEFETLGLSVPHIVFYLDVPLEIRKIKMIEDVTRNGLDLSEQDDMHQRACEQRAKLLAKRNGWRVIACAENGKMKTKEKIHEAIYESLVEFMERNDA